MFSSEVYRDEIYSLQILLSRTKAGPGRTVKQEQEQEEISPNHVQRLNLISVQCTNFLWHCWIKHVANLPWAHYREPYFVFFHEHAKKPLAMYFIQHSIVRTILNIHGIGKWDMCICYWHCTVWHIRLCKTSRWLQNKSSALVWTDQARPGQNGTFVLKST